MAIDDRLQNLDRRMAVLERGQLAIVNELQRVRRVETASRVVHGALPWAAMLVAIAALLDRIWK